MTFYDPTLYGRDEEEEFGDSGAYSEPLEEDFEEEEEEEEEPGMPASESIESEPERAPAPPAPKPAPPSGGGGAPKKAPAKKKGSAVARARARQPRPIARLARLTDPRAALEALIETKGVVKTVESASMDLPLTSLQKIAIAAR